MSEEQQEEFKAILTKFSKDRERQYREVIDSMNKDIASIALTVKNGEPGPKGDTGKTPTKEELLEIITPLIPKKAEPGAPGIRGKDADPLEVAQILLNNRYFLESVKGIPGKQGDDGSPDKPKEIAKKLNTLEESVDKKVIKGLIEELKNIKQAIRDKRGGGKSGGGMGSPQHELFNVSSVTTNVSTTYKIGAGGNSIWLYYNGQHFVKGTHYTVGSDQKTITFITTLQDNTKVAIDYIRT